MNYFTRNIFCFLVLVSLCGTSNAQSKIRVEKIQSITLHNLYQVDDSLQRSEQPNGKAMQELAQSGVKSVLNLRKFRKDHQANGTHLILIHVKMLAGNISYNDIVSALREIKKAPKPLLVHCKHGSDRTGCIVAAYCMVTYNYSKEDAIAELRNGYGFHEKNYPNIIALLNSLDINQLRKDITK